MPIDKSAPGGREAAQENITEPGHGANAMKNNHGQQGQAQQNNMAPNPGTNSAAYAPPEER